MKYPILLVLSLALNAILIGKVFFTPHSQSAQVERPAAEQSSSRHQASPPSQQGPVSQPVAAKPSPNRNQVGLAWRQSLQKLRDAGLSHDVLAGVVIAEFDRRWQQELREFERRYAAGAVDENERARFEARREAEQEKALRSALGEAGFQRWDKDYNLRDLDLVKLQLSSAQTDALYQLRTERTRQDRTLAETLRNGQIDEATYNEQEAAIQREYDQQFKMVVGDERYEALQNSEAEMRGSWRQKLKNLHSADSQVDAMVAIERNWNQQRAELERQAEAAPAQRKAYEEQMRALDASRDLEYQRVLGTHDFDQLQKNLDGRYQLLQRNAKIWSLSDIDIDYIYSSVQHYPEQDQRSRDQIEQSLSSYLGPQRFERLKKNALFALGGQ
jgi:hypothetical protein